MSREQQREAALLLRLDVVLLRVREVQKVGRDSAVEDLPGVALAEAAREAGLKF